VTSVPDLVLDGVNAGHLDAAHAFEEIALEAGDSRQVFPCSTCVCISTWFAAHHWPSRPKKFFAVEIGPHVAKVGVDAVGLVEAEGSGRRAAASEDDGGRSPPG